MIKIIVFFAIAAFIAICFTSCKTYSIPVESFKKQFNQMGPSLTKEVVVRDPWGGKTNYRTFPMDFIVCIDKNGDSVYLKMSPSLEIRFTEINNRRTTFYFDLIMVDENYVYGIMSRLIPSIRRRIPLDSIKKIEIQDGKKKYSYTN